ncbi:SusC/RagA family TonB-linked outer membrane protein [Flaviaesturariibacter amylovorans]|uniref:TonB-dependent receptor n=1 Tax=Flaviaesturariibacter amylovorans TaxID=1084520 RepID=A0ABP8HIH8_9BACT
MQTTVHGKRVRPHPTLKRGALFLCLFLFSLFAQGQTLTLSLKKVPLESAFLAIERQSPYRFTYTVEVLQATSPVTLEVSGASLETVLARLFEGQPLSYTVNKNYISVHRKAVPEKPAKSAAELTLDGIVRNDRGEPVPRATVAVKGSGRTVVTDAAGRFSIPGMTGQETLLITSIGHSARELAVNGRSRLEVILPIQSSMLDETVVIGYGTTTRRFSTGSVSRITAAEIARQPVTNPLAALQGRVAGLSVVQANGLPGSNFNVQIRGQNSIKQGTQPLYIIDGVPLMLNSTLAQVSPFISTTVTNPLNAINPSDIESIEVLKDADATAIYGSQGANGVVLITTKKGAGNKTRLSVNAYTGFSHVGRTARLLNTDQYLAMRREAFANDGVAPTAASAPDLLVWDSTRYTDWTKELIGGTARFSNIQATLSGGSRQSNILFSAGYSKETTVFPSNEPALRGSMRLNAGHQSTNGRFRADFSALYTLENKILPATDLTASILLPPNIPAMKDSAGNLAWVPGFDNPYAIGLQEYRGQNQTFLSNVLLQFEIVKGLTIKSSFGFSRMSSDEESRLPIKALRPSASARGSLQMGNAAATNWIAEPQLGYHRTVGQSRFEAMAGLSLQERRQKGNTITGSQYTSDDLLGNLAAAGQLSASNYRSQYNYTAVFGRLSYSYAKRYLLNLNARRDGSSRFGPANRFANFGAVGAGWVLSEEPFLQKRPSWINFAKIRGSYGVTGNDQIGDYLYLDAWTAAAAYQYGGAAGVLPSRLFNPYFQWERNRKLEVAADLILFQNRLSLTAAWYRNRSDNQLINYRLPSQTGFTTLLKNLDALVQNTGLEFEATSKNFTAGNFRWNTAFNISFPRNKLLRYPGLEISSDRFSYAIDQPLSVLHGFNYEGVDPQTGVYVFTDVNKDNLINSAGDAIPVGAMAVKYQGGLQNTFHYKGWEADFFFQFVNQTGRNYLAQIGARPGFQSNQPAYVLERWQAPGDAALVERFTQSTGTPAYAAYNNYRNSSASLSDASFIRLKNVSLAYSLPEKWLRKVKMEQVRLYIEGRNLLTITSYKGADPETQILTTLPPLKTLVAGVQLNF